MPIPPPTLCAVPCCTVPEDVNPPGAKLGDGLPDVLVFELPDELVFELPDGLVFELPDGLVFELPDGLVFELPDGLVFELPDGLVLELPAGCAPVEVVTGVPKEVLVPQPP